MDIVEFAEKICGAELYEWQKLYLKKLYELQSKGDVRIVMGPRNRVYIYLDPKTQKELIQNG